MLPTVETLIIAVEKADSANELLTAVENLAAAKSEAAIPTLTDVLRYNNPGASVAAVDGLIAIGKAAVPYLLANLDGYNYGARAWATRALAGIGDVRGLDLLLEAAVSDFSFSVRRGAARKLSQGDPEWVVRYAAIVGLEGLGTAAAAFRGAIRELLGQIRETEAEIVVRLRADQALEHLQ